MSERQDEAAVSGPMSGDPNGWDRDDYWSAPHHVRAVHRRPSTRRLSEDREFDEDRAVERAEREYEKWLDEIGRSR